VGFKVGTIDRTHGWLAGVLTMLLVLALVAGPAAAASPPDQLDPPGPGEGTPLRNPTEPPLAGYGTMAQPSPSITLDGRAWRRAAVGRMAPANRYVGSARVSRRGWSHGARRVVVAPGTNPFDPMVASSLAGTVGGPLLLTRTRSVPSKVDRELRRLNPGRIYVVGDMRRRVVTRLRNVATVVRVGRGNRYETSVAVARRAAKLGARRRTVIVAGGRAPAQSLGAAALAAGRRYPLVLTKRAGKRLRLQRRVRELGARRTLVIGNQSAVSAGIVRNLPRVRRLARPGAAGTAAVTAAAARRHGLRGSPVLINRKNWPAASYAGVWAGVRRDAPLLATAGRELADPARWWFNRYQPRKAVVLATKKSVPVVTTCQLRRGGMRRWYCAERLLHRQGYHMPHVDGRVDRFTLWAVYAFEKVAGRSANGSFGNAEWRRLLRNPRHKVRRPDLPSTHVEIDIGRQLILLVKNGKVAHHIHTSTGKSSTPMVRGTFTVYEKRDYLQTYNMMYRPIFFYRGYAIHGYPSVPTYPASHGCGRVYNGNMDFLYPKIFMGERVATY